MLNKKIKKLSKKFSKHVTKFVEKLTKYAYEEPVEVDVDSYIDDDSIIHLVTTVDLPVGKVKLL